MSKTDFTLDTLLDMDDERFFYPSGHWVKIEARRVPKSSNFPQGIKYSLTLHAPNNRRILGYDNAHLVPGDKNNNPYDHMHKGERIIKYPYQNAEQLLTDFYSDVEKILELEREYEYET